MSVDALRSALKLVPSGRAREYCLTGDMDRWFLIDRVRSSNIVMRRGFKGRKGRAPSEDFDSMGYMKWTGWMYRPIDILAFSVCHGWRIESADEIQKSLNVVGQEAKQLELKIAELKAEEGRLNERIAEKRHNVEFVDLTRHTGFAGFIGASIVEIIEAARPVSEPVSCGVYFLVSGSEVVYVGQSVNVHARIAEHSRWKEFDSAAFISVPKDALDFVESFYIHTLSPRLNGWSGGKPGIGKVSAPMNRIELHRRVCSIARDVA